MERIQRNVKQNSPFLQGIQHLQQQHNQILENTAFPLQNTDAIQSLSKESSLKENTLHTEFDFTKVFSENKIQIQPLKKK